MALGHPLGSSGSRIVVTLIHALKQAGKTHGAAGIYNGGGGLRHLVLEMVWPCHGDAKERLGRI